MTLISPEQSYEGDASGLDDPTGIPFAIENPDYRFTPAYYPSRLTQTRQNEVERKDTQCEGEDVYIKSMKNADIHIKGILLAKNITLFRRLVDSEEPIDLISPLAENGGIEAVIEQGKIGDIAGWDQKNSQWQFEYTLDIVSTGKDESTSGEKNHIVSQIIDKATE